jgi:hypothetical protein
MGVFYAPMRPEILRFSSKPYFGRGFSLVATNYYIRTLQEVPHYAAAMSSGTANLESRVYQPS